MHFFRSIFLTRLFFLLYGTIVVLFAAAFAVPYLLFIAEVCLIVLFGITLLDVLLTFGAKQPLKYERILQNRLNLGDVNEVQIKVTNLVSQPISFKLYEGFPVEMQKRSKAYRGLLLPGKQQIFDYSFTPKERGEYTFVNAFFLISSVFNLVSRKMIIEAEQTVKVYPSVLQMKKYELLVFQQQKTSHGIKKIRRIGHTSEFEQIKNYVQGDEIKAINWKATSRKNELMVNQYQEEKSPNIYCIIDKSRNMQVQFDGMSMLDYAINSTLVFSNIALRNGDKTGLLTFSDKIGSQLPAERSGGQMRRIIEELYDQKTHFLEPNYELLYQTIRRTIKTRSFLILFTNYETEFAMRRTLPMLRRINQKHVLVVVFFQNTDLQELAFSSAKTTKDIYRSAVAERMTSMKSRIAQELKQNGIQTILTLPSDLSINTINKYLELKAKGAI
jgi:uncharacterized protein (DUF58 family)